MSPRERFRIDEIGAVTDAIGAIAIARRLEAYADDVEARPADGFPDLVMSLVEAEPAPAPARALRAAARGGRIRAALAAYRDAWRVLVTGGRPLAARASSFALVVVLVAGLAFVGGGAAVATWNAFEPQRPPVVVASPSESAAPPSVTPSPRPSTSPSPSPSPSPTPSEGDHDDGSGDSQDHDDGSPAPR